MWYKNLGTISFVLSQITRLTNRQTDEQTDGRAAKRRLYHHMKKSILVTKYVLIRREQILDLYISFLLFLIMYFRTLLTCQCYQDPQ